MSDDRLARLLLAIENGGLDGVIIGALQGVANDHPAFVYRASIGKRVRGAVKGRIRELLGIGAPPRFDPWKAHCGTCTCEASAFARVEQPRGGRRRGNTTQTEAPPRAGKE